MEAAQASDRADLVAPHNASNFALAPKHDQASSTTNCASESQCKCSEDAQSPHVSIQLENTSPAFVRDNAIRRMLKNGWCPHKIRYLRRAVDLHLFDYLSSLERSPQRQEDHQRCRTKKSCIAYNVDMTSYQPRHTTKECDCRTVSVPYNKLIEIIQKGKVPLVEICDAGGGESIELRLEERSPGSTYTAISHVWADGLGNPYSNALPQCQLRSLNNTLLKLKSPFKRQYIWFDTLCIPAKDEHAHLRVRCIDAMGGIYFRAREVLVLDSELINFRSDDMTESLARLLLSAWMCRSWTLQEAVLSDRCTFNLGGRLYSMHLSRRRVGLYAQLRLHEIKGSYRRKVIRPRSNSKDPAVAALEKSIRTQILSLLFGSQPWRGYTREVRFTYAWSALSGRSTTKPEDLVAILANILGFSWADVRVKPRTTQLQAILFSLKTLPLALLLNTSLKEEHMHCSKNRWIPATLGGTYINHGPVMSRYDPVGRPWYRPREDHSWRVDLERIGENLHTMSCQYLDKALPRSCTSTDVLFDTQLFTLHFEMPANQEYPTGYFSHTVLVLERRPSATTQDTRAAILLVHSWKKEMEICRYSGGDEFRDPSPVYESFEKIQTTYLCPGFLKRASVEAAPEGTLKAHDFTEKQHLHVSFCPTIPLDAVSRSKDCPDHAGITVDTLVSCYNFVFGLGALVLVMYGIIYAGVYRDKYGKSSFMEGGGIQGVCGVGAMVFRALFPLDAIAYCVFGYRIHRLERRVCLRFFHRG